MKITRRSGRKAPWKSRVFPHILFILFLLSGGQALLAQESQYVVFFTDKDTLAYDLDRPEEFLSSRAIERRSRQNITLTYADIPVKEAYLNQLRSMGAEVYYKTRWLNGALIEVSPEELESITAQDFVIGSELVKPRGRGSRRKSGSSFGSTKSARVQQEPLEQLLNIEQNDMLGIDEMHEDGFNGSGLLVAVFDGGFRGVDTVSYFQHLYEDGRMLPGYDFVGNSTDVYNYGQHGTEALSCIGAYIPNVLEAGAYGAEFMLCVTEETSSEYRIEEYNWLFAAEFADSTGADIISTSLGYTTFNDSAMDYSYEDLDGQTAVITRAVDAATDRGIICVISAGNEGSGSWRYVSPPADAQDVLAVGAVSTNRDKVSFSSYGPSADGRVKPDVSALGLQTVVVDASGNVTTSNGTSFAAPLIAGFVAGVWQAFPDATNLEIMEKVRLSGDKAITPNNETGYGIPDYERLMESYLTPIKDVEKKHEYKVYPNPVEDSDLIIEPVQGYFEGKVQIHLYSPQGRLLLEKEVDQFKRNSLTVEMDGLAKGIYIMHILSASTSDTLKIVKF
ncbi:S8 family serine peptidase [Catalinimonas niigatensis]|uniref:S8 family serine peptidase n=1 Tax=Catalinimonas niigatensis TaxID=1397264 RepID=UPI0026657720|nr:S8 family serine peptidase [Catalinimonas niigatensis]WPP49561.1 S8 family serine peptidase [Catalinimonas niigatensis]